MATYDHQVLRFSPGDLDSEIGDRLSGYGGYGWHVVGSYFDAGTGWVFILERKKGEQAD